MLAGKNGELRVVDGVIDANQPILSNVDSDARIELAERQNECRAQMSIGVVGIVDKTRRTIVASAYHQPGVFRDRAFGTRFGEVRCA